MTPLLQTMLREMRVHLTVDDVRAGLPVADCSSADVSLLYADWVMLRNTERRQLQRIAELDADIARMGPWGDYPMASIDQLSQQGKSLGFWRCTQTQFEGHWAQWKEKYNAELVSQQDGFCYFVTKVPQGNQLEISEAQPVDVPPCPISTLIMLQTRAKDSLRQVRLEMGDFSLQHYREVEAALGLSDTLHVTNRHYRFWKKVCQIITKFKSK